ncbi:EamA family transporter [Tsukamurella sp. 8F]|uniref:EamA family transporter n=1 Tax=unclassified Tsukamurella TaxID=2633480 RepID=UPI0023B96385|nr:MULTISPECIES: EamA family transporter [unclassified Tsukamurella]MDF0532072.1 EamA family transporter [Tsukamurella sp. 8J]MDF0589184.1 EamA family transporter [Tsukamurella sp. 8F]
MSPRHRLVALSVVVLWGLNFLAIRYGLDYFPPLFMAGLRFLVIAIPVIAFVSRPQVPLRWMLLYGLGFGTLQFMGLFLAMHLGMPTGLASLVLQTSAPFTVVLGALLLRERITTRQIAGITVAMAGMALILVDRAEHSAAAGVIPVLLTIGGGLAWAFGNIGSRLAEPADPLRFTLWMTVVPPVPLLTLSAVVEGPTTGWRALAHSLGSVPGREALAGLAYVVLLGTIAGSGLWTWLMARYPSSTVAPVSLLVPVVGIAASFLILHERPTLLALAGGIVVLAGCFAGLTGARPTRPAPEAEPVRV